MQIFPLLTGTIQKKRIVFFLNEQSMVYPTRISYQLSGQHYCLPVINPFLI